jgi:hypothetical protein
METTTFKATGMDFLRKKLRKNGNGAEEALLAELTADEADLYANALAVSWIDVAKAARVYDVAARAIYPKSAEPLVDLGRDMARADLTGIYKVLLRVATIPMVVERTARLWSTYHRRGTARIVREGDAKRADLVIDGYPDLPEAIRVNISGYVQGVLDLTGSKNPQVSHIGGSPDAWRWHVTWE